MQKLNRLLFAAAFVAATAGSARAEVKAFTIDPVHSGVFFEIRHLYSPFRGRFNEFEGTLSVDPDDPSTMQVAAEVNVVSVDTANADRDKHLRTADFFDVGKFAKAKFVSSKAVTGPDNTGEVHGNLTIRGVTKPVVFKGKFTGYGMDHRKGNRAGFQAAATIDRRDFGIPYNLELPNGVTVLGYDVTIELRLEVIEMDEKEAKAAGLQAELDKYKSGRKPLPDEIAEALAKAADEIAAQGNINGIAVGEKAPEFVLTDAHGKPFALSDQLKKGPVVLVFYRGEWCPFCNMQLRALEKAHPQIQLLGAEIVAISPQNENKSSKQAAESNLTFPLLTDATGDTLRAYRLLYHVPDEMKKVYKDRFGIDLDEYNGEDRWDLPVTATFIIGKDGIVKAREVDIDYTKRMEPADIIEVLQAL